MMILMIGIHDESGGTDSDTDCNTRISTWGP